MYSIQININKRKLEFDGAQPGQQVGVLRKDGELSFRPFAGFVEICRYPIKISVTGYCENGTWTRLPEGSIILGCWHNERVYAVIPFKVLGK